ncbi:MAG: FAD-binding oxidoreductase [Planctomycetota bacterium]
MRARTLIVGGGVMGNSIALAAARRFDPLREPVVLLERGSLGVGSSGSSGAILRQHYASRTIASMARDSLRVYSSFESRTGRGLGYMRPGVLTLAGPSRPETIERLERNVAQHREMGIDTEIIDAPRIRQLVPQIEVDDRAIGAWEPHGGYVDPALTVQQFAALARTYGAVTRMGVEIQSIQVDGGRVIGAETSEGHYESDQVVIVAGAHCLPLLEQLGTQLPLKVARVEQRFYSMPGEDREDGDGRLGETSGWNAVNLDDPLESERDRMGGGDDPIEGLPHPVILDLEYGFYTRPEPLHGRTRVCPIGYDAAKIYDAPASGDTPCEEQAAWAREVLCKRLPIYRDEPELEAHVSWFPLTPDGRAVIGPVPDVEGAYIAAGFADHGFKLAPAVGEGVAQMLAGEPVAAFDASYFDPARYRGEGALERQDWSGQLYL